MTAPLRVDGADISHHQTSVDLSAAKAAGLKWLYHKASEGTTYRDPVYHDRRAAASAAGLSFGGYHFARPDGGDAAREARAFLDFARPEPGDLRPVLDLEVTGGLSHDQLRIWAQTWMRAVAGQVGVLPILYCPWDLSLPGIKWVPRYNDTNTPPAIPWDIWQFSNGRYGVPERFDGVGAVDLNHMRDGLGITDLQIPAEGTATEVQLHHASQQWGDPDRESRADLTAALSRGAHLVSFTEVYSRNLQLLRDVAPGLGYTVVHDGRADAPIAVKQGLEVLDHGAELVNPAEPGQPPAGGHSARWAQWVRVKIGPEDVFHVVGHWVTGYSTNAERRLEWARMSKAIGRLVEANAAGSKVGFFAGDTNLNDTPGSTAYAILEAEDLTTCWDELKTYPGTHGRETIDVIGSYDPDVRVAARSAKAWPLGNSDHRAVSAVYSIAPARP